jgi:hypothetical protein
MIYLLGRGLVRRVARLMGRCCWRRLLGAGGFFGWARMEALGFERIVK